MSDQLRVLRHTIVVAFAELRTVYTWRSWTFGWMLRLLFQVAFFASIGYLIGSEEAVRYLLVGNAVLLVALEATVVIMASISERQSGTLPLLMASPAGYLTVFMGRGLHWIATGVTSASVTLFLLAPVFGVSVSPAAAVATVPILLVIGASAYCYGAAIGSVVLRVMESRWFALNVSYMSLMAFAGVNVPVEFWPRAVQVVAQGLPVTHGLQAVRLVLSDGTVDAILVQVALEAVVGLGWLGAAAAGYALLGRSGRRDGSIEFTV